MSFLKKADDLSNAKLVQGRMVGVMTGLPALVEYMSAGSYPDGQQRETSTLSVFLEHGVVKACLNDRDAGRTLWRAAPGLEDALLALELALVEGSADWRISAAAAGRGGKGRR